MGGIHANLYTEEAFQFKHAFQLKEIVRGKRTILKTEITRKQSSPNFPKNDHFLPPDMHTCMCVSGVRNIRFLKNLWCFVFL